MNCKDVEYCEMRGDEMPCRERGFILVTSLILIAIITILGVAAAYKTVVGSKVSKLTGDSAKALEIANSGLNHVFWVWNAKGANASYAGYQDLVNTINLINGDSPANSYPLTVTATTEVLTTHMYVPGLVGETLDQIETAAGGSFDAYAQAGNNIRIYEYIYDANGVPTGMQLVANNTWATGMKPQVAVWVASYQAPANASSYPYGPANAGCTGSGCRIVVYALGRDGESRRLVRETQGLAQQQLAGVSAMTNASPYGNWSELCAETDPPTNTGSVSAWNSSLQNTVLEVTQAPYLRDLNNVNSNPSGTAIISNTDVGGGGKGFNHGDGLGATMGTSFENSPNLLYAGHGSTQTDAQARSMLSSATQDNTAPYDNLPPGELPHNLVRAPMIGSASGPLQYFSDSNSQLFDLDAYRWAAEQFTCQKAPFTAAYDGVNGNGRYCSKAEKLRQAMAAIDPYATAPVSGRLTVAEFEHNANYGIPMFGMVRVMIPTTSTGTSYSCTVNGVSESGNFYNVSGSVATMTTNSDGSPGYDGTLTQVDSDGVLDGTARAIVYGSILFDYFKDDGAGPKSGNNNFDPYSGESLLKPLEAAGSYMKIEFPLLLNPVLPRGTKILFPTAAAGGTIATGSADNPVNLASPTGGYFPASEGLLQKTGSTTYADGLAGTMRLMTNTANNGLVDLANKLRTGGSYSAQPGNAATMFSNEKAALKYYYDLMVANAKRSDNQAWPIAPFPSSLSDNFYIGQEDENVGNNDGDRLHLLFPSGYMHGWKVALAALDMKASDWNSLLTGIGTPTTGLAAQHNPAFDVGDAGMPKGSPFHPTLDAGFSSAATLESDQAKFFYVDSSLPAWQALTGYNVGSAVVATSAGPTNTHVYTVIPGTTDVSAPTWPTSIGDIGTTVLSGTVTMQAIDAYGQTTTPFNTSTSFAPGVVLVPAGFVAPTAPNTTLAFKVVPGTSGATEPTWPTGGGTVVDGTVTWKEATTVPGYGYLTDNWQDIPAEMYVGGLLDMHAHSNINGIVYTPGPLEWEPGNSSYAGNSNHLSYINGAIITGFGAYLKNKRADGRYVLVYANEAVDNINTRNTNIVMRRFGWQEVK